MHKTDYLNVTISPGKFGIYRLGGMVLPFRGKAHQSQCHNTGTSQVVMTYAGKKEPRTLEDNGSTTTTELWEVVVHQTTSPRGPSKGIGKIDVMIDAAIREGSVVLIETLGSGDGGTTVEDWWIAEVGLGCGGNGGVRCQSR